MASYDEAPPTLSPDASYGPCEAEMDDISELAVYLVHQGPQELSYIAAKRLEGMAETPGDLATAIGHHESRSLPGFLPGFIIGKTILDRLDARRGVRTASIDAEAFIVQQAEDRENGGAQLITMGGALTVVTHETYLKMQTPLYPAYCSAVRVLGITAAKEYAPGLYRGASSVLRLHVKAVKQVVGHEK